MRRVLLFALVTLEGGAGCVSAARIPTASDAVRFEEGRTTKEEVVNRIGLPNRMEQETLEGGVRLEVWYYFKKPDRVVVFVGRPVWVAAVIRRTQGPRKDIALVVVFSGTGVVVDAGVPPEDP